MSENGLKETRTNITVGFIFFPPHCVPEYDSYGNITNLFGNFAEIIKGILQYYNWSAIYIKSEEDGLGIQSSNGTWSSVMGLLIRNQVDISQVMQLSFDRSSAIPFSIPLFYEEVTFATRAPGYLSKVFVFLKPFSLKVWMVLLTTVCLFGIFWSIFNTVFKYQDKNIKMAKIDSVLSNVITPGSYTKQIWTEQRSSLRFAIISWSLFVLILSVTYGGVLTSFMTAPLKEAPIDSLETLVNLVNEMDYKVGSLPGLTINFAVTKAAVTRNLRLKYPNHATSASTSRKAAVLRMLNERYAFAWFRSWLPVLFTEIGKNVIDKFHISPENQETMFLSMGISPQSKLKDKIDTVVLIEHESGLIPKWNEDMLMRSRVKEIQSKEIIIEEKDEQSAYTPLTLFQCSGAFFILGFGYCLSILILVYEVLACNKTVTRILFGCLKVCNKCRGSNY